MKRGLITYDLEMFMLFDAGAVSLTGPIAEELGEIPVADSSCFFINSEPPWQEVGRRVTVRMTDNNLYVLDRFMRQRGDYKSTRELRSIAPRDFYDPPSFFERIFWLLT